jgi:ATP-binding cassette subfamily B protein
MESNDLLLKRVPVGMEQAAARNGVPEGDCLFCVRADLHSDGTPSVVWLVVGKEKAVALHEQNGDTPVAGPFKLSEVTKVRTFMTVGSSFLQFKAEGVFVNVVRFSHAKRETFGRARLQLERLIEGKAYQEEALKQPSDFTCGKCGLPLPGRRAACPRCARHHGFLVRSVLMMRPYWGSIGLLLLFMLLGVCLDLLPPRLTGLLVDKVLVPKENFSWLPWILLSLVTASLTRSGISIMIGRLSSKVGTQVTKELREKLEQKLMGMSVDYYDRHSVGSLMSRVLYDVDYFQGFVAQVAQGFLLNLMMVIGVGVMLFTMNWFLALLVLLPIPFVIMGTIIFWRYIYPRYYRVWDSQSKMAQHLSGLLSGIRLVKSFGQEEQERERFSECATYMQTSRRRLEMGAATFHPLMGFVFGLGGLIVWYAGGGMVYHEKISLGTLMAFFGYLGMFYSPISALSMFSNWLTGFLSSSQRVFEILDSNSALPVSESPKSAPAMKGEIEFRNVTFGYDPYTPILKNVSFKIEPGQFIGVVGKSGSGKTTLVNLICRFYDPQQGEVFIDGAKVEDIDTEDLHKQVGLVLQEPFLFRASIADNISYGRPNSSSLSVMDAAKAANAHEFISRRPAGYDTKLGERGAGLSGGERQRVSIARALLCNPKILILDEATSSVDTESEQEIQKTLSKVCKGRTTIAIAHRLSTLKNSDRIFVIDEGKIVESGTHEELLALENGIYRKLVKIQTELTRIED